MSSSWAGWVALLCALLHVGVARADEAPRIAVVHDATADERTILRLRGELSTLGLRVVDVQLVPNEGASSLDDAARRVDAFAAVRVVHAGAGVEVWVADRVTGKTLLRELVAGPGNTADDVVALQAVELLRASLAELGLSPKQHGDVPATPAVRRIAPLPDRESTASHHVFLQLAPAATISPGGFGATGGALLGLRFRSAGSLGVDGWTLLPFVSTSVGGAEGSASLSPILAGIDGAVWFFEPRAPWQLTLGGGLAVARLGVEGHPVAPRTGSSDPVTVAVPLVRFAASRRLTSRFSFGVEGFVGLAVPEPVVRFEGRRVADWGRPVTALALSLDVALD